VRFDIRSLKKRILKRVVHDPVTMSTESPDCVRGDVCHVGVLPDQSGAMRSDPRAGRVPHAHPRPVPLRLGHPPGRR
jgi:hypothetical protein